jgi:HEAT repeat protein
MGDRRAGPLLLAVLKDEDTDTAASAAWALAELGDPAGTDALAALPTADSRVGPPDPGMSGQRRR